MANIKVRDLTDTTAITTDNQVMVLTDDAQNQVQNISIENFINNINSTDNDNGISIGTDKKLYVNNSDSGVIAGTYQYPQNLIVDSKGRITSIGQGQPANVPTATTSQAGVVKPDGTTINVEEDGTITAAISSLANVDLSNLSATGILNVAKMALGSIHYDANDFSKIGAYWGVTDLTSGSVSLPANGYWLVFDFRYYANTTASDISTYYGVGIMPGGSTYTVQGGAYPHYFLYAIRIVE